MWTSLKRWSGKVARVLSLETDYPQSPLTARRRPGPEDGNPELGPFPDRLEALTSVEIRLGGGSGGQTPRGWGQALVHRCEHRGRLYCFNCEHGPLDGQPQQM